jgi:hypothetical protein
MPNASRGGKAARKANANKGSRRKGAAPVESASSKQAAAAVTAAEAAAASAARAAKAADVSARSNAAANGKGKAFSESAVKLATWMEATNLLYNVAPDEVPGCPDDSGDGTWTIKRGVTNLLQVQPDPGTGVLVCAVAPRLRRGIAVSGVVDQSQRPMGKFMDGGAVFGQQDVDTTDAFEEGFSNSSTYLQVQPSEDSSGLSTGTSGNPPAAAADIDLAPYTVPFQLEWPSADDTYALQTRARYAADKKGYYFDMGELLANSTDVDVMVQTFVTGLFASGTDNADFAFMLMGSTNAVPAFDGGSDDVILAGNNCWIGENASEEITIHQSHASQTSSGSLATYKSMYLIVFGHDSDFAQAYLARLQLTFAGLEPPTAETTIGTGFLYVFDNVLYKQLQSARLQARFVCSDVTLTNVSPEMYRGGTVAAISQPATDSTGVFEVPTFQTLAEKRGSYVGDLAKGAHGYHLPVSYERYLEYESINRKGYFEDDPIITFVASVPQVLNEGTTSLPPVSFQLKVNTCMQLITESPVLCPDRDNGLAPQDEDASCVYRETLKILRTAPIVGENPSHEQWAEWARVAASKGLKAAKGFAKAAWPVLLKAGIAGLGALL